MSGEGVGASAQRSGRARLGASICIGCVACQAALDLERFHEGAVGDGSAGASTTRIGNLNTPEAGPTCAETCTGVCERCDADGQCVFAPEDGERCGGVCVDRGDCRAAIGQACASNEGCASNACAPAAGSASEKVCCSKACSGSTPRCLGDGTTCVQCGDNRDCGIEQECDASNTCGECLPGTTSCNGDTQQLCMSDRTLVDNVQCSFGCLTGERSASCYPECRPKNWRCLDTGALQRCDDAGFWQPEQDCLTAALCQNNACLPPACAVGSGRGRPLRSGEWHEFSGRVPLQRRSHHAGAKP